MSLVDRTRIDELKFQQRGFRIVIRKNFLVKPWNRLPRESVGSLSLVFFQEQVRQVSVRNVISVVYLALRGWREQMTSQSLFQPHFPVILCFSSKVFQMLHLSLSEHLSISNTVLFQD